MNMLFEDTMKSMNHAFTSRDFYKVSLLGKANIVLIGKKGAGKSLLLSRILEKVPPDANDHSYIL
jgi:predicted ATPase with chaperone activity